MCTLIIYTYNTAGLFGQYRLEKSGYTKTAKVVGSSATTIAGAMLGGLAIGGPGGAMVGGILGFALWLVSDTLLPRSQPQPQQNQPQDHPQGQHQDHNNY